MFVLRALVMSPTAKWGTPSFQVVSVWLKGSFFIEGGLTPQMIFFLLQGQQSNIQVQTEVAAKWANQPTRKRNQGPIIIGPQGAVLYTIKQSCLHKSKLSLLANLQKSRNGNPNTLQGFRMLGGSLVRLLWFNVFRHTSRFSCHRCFDRLPFAAFCLPVFCTCYDGN